MDSNITNVFRGAATDFDLEYVLKVCMRLRRMKHRSIYGSAVWRQGAPKIKKVGYQLHHLTPRCREGQPYHGGGKGNLLFIAIGKHRAWHALFGVCTLEEIIVVLMVYLRLNVMVWIILDSLSFPVFSRRSKFLAAA